MNSFRRVVTHCRIGLHVKKHSLFTTVPTQICYSFCTRSFVCNLHTFGANNMSQKSITSFFKMTPKKAAEVNLENHDEQTSNGQRLESNHSEQDSPKSIKRKCSPFNSETSKKSKRLRIESSSSEEGSAEQVGEQEKIKVENFTKPKTDKSTEEAKIEKSSLVETEESKNKKSEKNEAKSVIKKESEDIKAESSEQTEVVTKSVKKSRSPQRAAKVEEERTTPETKKGPKNVMSFFVKKEVNGNEGEAKETGVVREEDYNPAKPKYHPISDACWAEGQPVPYLALAKTLEAIEETSSRLKIVETLANYFRSVMALTPDDLLPSVYMCLNQLAPAYHGLELGIAETYLMKAIGQCTGQSLAQVKAAAHKAGDLGRVAQSARARQRTMLAPPKLSCRRVFAALQEIARMTGAASVNKKIAKIQGLYVACRACEARFLFRSLEGKLRVGLAEQSALQALAQAAALHPPGAARGLTAEQLKARLDEHARLLKSAYCERPDLGALVPALLRHGAPALPRHCRLTPGVPLKPMLAQPTRGVHEVLDRFENEKFTCEWKYDGERAQIHVPSSTDGTSPDFANARVFSRNQEDNTSKYPDVLRRLPALLKDSVVSCVLDTEAVAYDVSNKQILPFQILSTRKRKDANEAEIKVQVCVFAFDLLYLNGQPLVKLPLADRRELLRTHFNEVEGEWQFAAGADCSTLEEVQALLDESIKKSCEGLMVKTLHGPSAAYDIARRSHNWLKLKKDYLEGVGDSIDAVVLGGYRGRGKRAGVFGGFLLACYDADADEYQSLCKLGTGFSDEQLRELSAALQEKAIAGPRSYYRFDPAHAPDAWFAAGAVWELRCADLSLSPAHRAAAGLLHRDKGVSLRFPRFVRVRDDKAPEQATSARQIADMYLAQDQVRNQAAKPAPQDDFY